MIYLTGSLRNAEIPLIAKRLREEGFTVFDDWHSPGPFTDEHWQKYETLRGRTYVEALNGHHANTQYELDLHFLIHCDTGVLVMPAGKSSCLELGFLLGQGKPGYVLFPGEPERYDLMFKLATGIFLDLTELIKELKRVRP